MSTTAASSDAFIIDGIRTPVGNLGGALSPVRADDMAAHTIAELMRRNPNVDPVAIADVVLGCANQAGEDNRNVARMASLLAGLPASVPGETVNRLCASGLSAVAAAARSLKIGEGDLYVAGGVESMTRAPFVMSKGSSAFARDVQLFDTSLGWRFVNPKMKAMHGTDSMGETAENVAEQFGVSRDDQDAFAVRSQRKAAKAQLSGVFAEEIIGYAIPQKKGEAKLVDNDEFLRPETTVEILGKLKPAFRTDGNGTVTAGNAAGLNDGAAALLMASAQGVRDFGLTAMARVVASAAAGVPPRIMGMGPVPATQRALKLAGLSLNQIDVIELNEAFAAQSLACLRELGVDDDDARVNINGGAIALGHPLGMSGARLALTAVRQLHRSRKRYALCTMCIGVGQGYA
ncbi:MAG: 3-oxoadipyl-CoA thiolase, partial [Gemmatimonadota bacterium]|nr:3-oxoadipyl-CoA thiolase [Gemmatimonadota bacterium]